MNKMLARRRIKRTVGGKLTAYCLRCRRKVPIVGQNIMAMRYQRSNGGITERRIAAGRCGTCGTEVRRFV